MYTLHNILFSVKHITVYFFHKICDVLKYIAESNVGGNCRQLNYVVEIITKKTLRFILQNPETVSKIVTGSLFQML